MVIKHVNAVPDAWKLSPLKPFRGSRAPFRINHHKGCQREGKFNSGAERANPMWRQSRNKVKLTTIYHSAGVFFPVECKDRSRWTREWPLHAFADIPCRVFRLLISQCKKKKARGGWRLISTYYSLGTTDRALSMTLTLQCRHDPAVKSQNWNPLLFMSLNGRAIYDIRFFMEISSSLAEPKSE